MNSLHTTMAFHLRGQLRTEIDHFVYLESASEQEKSGRRGEGLDQHKEYFYRVFHKKAIGQSGTMEFDSLMVVENIG